MQGEELMRKIGVISLFLLFSIIGAVLFFQWQIYSNYMEDEENVNSVISQQLLIESKAKKLQVKQTIEGLAAGESYQLLFPEQISEWSCWENEKHPCQISKNELMVERENSVITFTYS